MSALYSIHVAVLWVKDRIAVRKIQNSWISAVLTEGIELH